MGVGEGAATALALVIHELATNSLKYGALSVDTGVLDVSSDSQGEEVIVTWTERGGPPIAAPSIVTGYGSTLVQRSMSAQLGGSIERDWSKDGLIVTLRMNAKRLAA
jgi:two-component sensor histidine kinase